MVAQLVRLKLTLLGNGFRRSVWQTIGFVLGSLYALAVVGLVVVAAVAGGTSDPVLTGALLALVGAVALLAGFWMLVLKPKREEVAELKKQVTAETQRRDEALARVRAGEEARRTFAEDYATVARLGKAVPEDDDVRSLLVQLDAEAGGTHVDFRSMEIGAATTSAPAAQDGTATTTSPPPGAVPVGTGGLAAMPFSFSFRGSFDNLTQFFARMERFVTLRNEQLNVTGRLLRLESIDLQVDEKGFPHIRAQIGASSYLLPPSQGVTAGATPQGPTGAAPPGGSGAPASSPTSPPSPTPTATP